MVGPVPDADRDRSLFRAKVGTVLLVGVSSGLITLQGDPSLVLFLGAVGGGLVVGALVVWYLFPDAEALAPASKRRRFRD